MKQSYFKLRSLPRLFGITVVFGTLVSSYSWSQQLKQNTSQQNYSAINQKPALVDGTKNGPFGNNAAGEEVIEKRTKNAKHFKNADGTYTAQVGGNYHYKDEQGKWQDIDLNIESGATGKPGYFFKSVKNDVKSYFPKNAGTEGVVMQLENGSEFVWWKDAQMRIVSNGNAVQVKKPAAAAGTASNEKLVYQNLYNTISEEFVVLNGGIENNIVLHSMTPELTSLSSGSTLEFSQFIPLQNNWKIFNAEGKPMTADFETTDFGIQMGNADSKIYFGRVIVFDDAVSKEEAMLIHAPSDKLSTSQQRQLKQSVYAGSYKVRFVNGGVEITSALPAAWLKEAGRSFPVTIDPTVTITPPASSGNFYGPMTHWYGYQRHASLYLQSEIGVYGTITNIEYNSTNAGVAGSRPTKVFMRTLAASTLTGGGVWNSTAYTSGAQLCLDQNTDQGNTAGWKNLTLTNPFPYSQDNLLIMVYDTWGGSGSTKYYNQSSTAPNRQVYNRVDGTDPGDGAGLTLEADRLTEIRITYTPASTCTGLPASATASSSASTVCSGVPITLSLTGLTLSSGLSVQWQSSTNGGTNWNNLGTAQTILNYTVSGGQTVATQYRAVITCVPTSDEITSSVVSVGQQPIAQCYCINTIPFNCTDGDLITNVTIESINNNSTCGNTTMGYSDYTTSVAPAQLQAGTSVPVSVTVGPSGAGWMYESVGVWIDYNQNGLLDSIEGEYTNVGTGLNAPVTANIVIPATALPGQTRMRVVVAASITMQSAFVCGPVSATENYGEMEDYTVNIIVPAVVVDSVVVQTQGGVPAQITTPAGTLQLQAAVYPLTVNQSVTWSVIPVSGAATISAGGLVTAQANGTVWAKAISVEDITKADSILVTLTNQTIVVDSVVVQTQGGVPAQITTAAGTLQLQATVYPLTVNQSVTWSVIPVSGAATISAGGLVTAQANGTVWAKAVSVQNPTKADSILVTITNQTIAVDSVMVQTQGGVPAQITTPAGTLQLQATVYPLTVNQSVTWSIIPVSGAATISTGGLVTAQANGTVWAKAVSVQNPAKADSILITISNQDLGVSTLNLSDFKIYPNPTSDLITLQSAEEHAALNLTITDITGKVLFSDQLISNALHAGYQVELSGYSSGVYILRLTGGDTNIQQQIVKK